MPSAIRLPGPQDAMVLLAGTALSFLMLLENPLQADARSSLTTKTVESRPSESFRFFVIGDWGREGVQSQKDVANRMALVAESSSPDFILSTGDNFYTSGLKSKDDYQFEKTFTKVYHQRSLRNIPWFAVLGNHDYGEGVDPNKEKGCAANSLKDCPKGCCYSPIWQYTEALKSRDKRWHCHNGTYSLPRTYPFPNGRGSKVLEVLLVDTNPFINHYMDNAFARNAEGLVLQNKEKLKKSLGQELQAMSSRWRVVVGHHPVVSYGGHCHRGIDCKEMAFMEDLMEKEKVDLYLSGHDHNLQFNKKSGKRVHYVVSGAGSLVRKEDLRQRKKEHMRWGTSSEPGFVMIEGDWNSLTVTFFIASSERPAYSYVIRK